VISRLLLEPSARLSRERLAADLWPDLDRSLGLQNLRPALTYARTALDDPDAIRQDGQEIVLSKSVASDWRDANHRERTVMVSTTSEERLQHLLMLDGLIRTELLDGCEGEWVHPFRDRHHQRRIRTLEQLAEEFAATKAWDSSLETLRRLFVLEPLSEIGIWLQLRILGELGQTNEALRVFNQYRSRLQDELGFEVSSELKQLAKRAVSGSMTVHQTRPITSLYHEMISHLLDSLIVNDPDRVMAMVSAPELNWSVVLHGPELYKLFVDLLKVPGPLTPDRAGVTKRLLQYCYQDLRYDEIIPLAESLLESKTASDRIAALNYLGMVSQQWGDFAAAEGHFEAAINLSSAENASYLLAVSRANRGSLIDCLGRHAEAEAEFNDILDELRSDQTMNGKYTFAQLIELLLKSQLAQGDVKAAIQTSQELQGYARANGLFEALDVGLVLHGYVLILTDEPSGVSTLIRGLDRALANRRKSSILQASIYGALALNQLEAARSVSVTREIAGAVLAYLHENGITIGSGLEREVKALMPLPPKTKTGVSGICILLIEALTGLN